MPIVYHDYIYCSVYRGKVGYYTNAMKIHNPHELPVLDYRLVKPLQGDLKDLSDTNHAKLLRVLQRRGFTTPLYVWKNGEDYYLLDGHQRRRVMMKNDLNDEGSYLVPYLRIAAADEQDAKAQLLEITSQYGTITIEGLDEFAFDLELEDINFDAINMERLAETIEMDKPTQKTDKRYTVEQLRDKANNYGRDDLDGFIAWLDNDEI